MQARVHQRLDRNIISGSKGQRRDASHDELHAASAEQLTLMFSTPPIVLYAKKEGIKI